MVFPELETMEVFFCQWQLFAAWLDSKEEGRGEASMNFILTERDVLGEKASAIRRIIIIGVRFIHIFSGGDFTKVGPRRQILPK